MKRVIGIIFLVSVCTVLLAAPVKIRRTEKVEDLPAAVKERINKKKQLMEVHKTTEQKLKDLGFTLTEIKLILS